MAQHVKEVVGIELNRTNYEKAVATYQAPNLSFVHSEARLYLSESKKTFDVLILSHILEHLDAPIDFLEQFRGQFRFVYIEVPDYHKTLSNLYRADVGLH